MIEVLDPAAARQALTAGRIRCPDCTAPVRPWGRARTRTVRDRDGQRRTARPDRARCTGCHGTHVLLDARLLAHRGYTIALVGQALLAAATGAGHRRIAADLDVPPGTVRGWLRRVRAIAGPLHQQAVQAIVLLDPEVLPMTTRTDPLTLVLDTLGAAALAFSRCFARHDIDPWSRINLLTHGRLLTAAPAD